MEFKNVEAHSIAVNTTGGGSDHAAMSCEPEATNESTQLNRCWEREAQTFEGEGSVMSLVICEKHRRSAGEHVSRPLADAVAAGDVQPTRQVEVSIEEMEFPAAVLVSEVPAFEAEVSGKFNASGRMDISEESQLNRFLARLTAVCMVCLNEYRERGGSAQ